MSQTVSTWFYSLTFWQAILVSFMVWIALLLSAILAGLLAAKITVWLNRDVKLTAIPSEAELKERRDRDHNRQEKAAMIRFTSGDKK